MLMAHNALVSIIVEVCGQYIRVNGLSGVHSVRGFSIRCFTASDPAVLNKKYRALRVS